MKFLRLTIYSALFLYICIGSVNHAQATPAIPFVSVVDPGNGTGTDYTSLNAWNNAVKVDLTAAGTRVFGGTLTSTIADGATVYFCRGGVYQSKTATATHANAAGTQILVSSIGAPVPNFNVGDIWYTNNTCNSANYFTISDTGNSATASAKCRTSTGAADTTAVSISGWTTGVNNYVRIWTDPAENYRHKGVWDTSKYRLEVSNAHAIYSATNFIIIDGIQIKVTDTSQFYYGIAARGINAGDTTNIQISNNIINCDFSGGATNNYGITNYSTTTSNTFKYWNNIIYGTSNTGTGGIYMDSGTLYAYNNTVANLYYGIRGSGGTTVIKNNIVQNTTSSNYTGSFDAASANNISFDNTSPNSGGSDCGGHSCRTQTVAFSDATNKDFHLAFADTAARKSGADLHADAGLLFSTDIDGHTRPNGAWDIGADQGAIHVFYSVGDSASDLKVASNVTVTSGAAVFVSAQTGNIGVGDKVIYNGITAYISAKTNADKMHWTLITATGGVPTDSGGAVATTSITHAFNHLGGASGALQSGAGVGAKGASYLNTSDLYAGNYILNIPCYYDTAADNAAVTIGNWTTTVPNYIKVYTPVSTLTESNSSQRASGKWDTNKYRLEATGNIIISVTIASVKIDGLQIKHTYTTDDTNVLTINSLYASNGATQDFSNNIIQGNFTNISTHSERGIWVGSAYSTYRIYNNIIYGYDNGYSSSSGIYTTGDPTYGVNSYVYNNTVYNAYECFHFNTGAGFVLKNNIAQCSNAGYKWGAAAGSTNNLSSLADAPGTNPQNSKTVSFVSIVAGSEDFHLTQADNVAQGIGADLSADTNYAFNIDIDGNSRTIGGTGVWDIGADQVSHNVYYSVGDSASNLMVASNVTVTSGAAVFVSAQTGNIGVGDKVIYNGITAYISAKTNADKMHWTLITATGGVPTDSGGAVATTSITHAFNNLNAAVNTGVFGASYINTTDIVAGNYIVNVPCYYDSAADTAAVTLSGETTGPQNWIKIYTPTNISTEANNSQRHSGKWDTTKYRLDINSGNVAITSNVNYIIFDGLQIKETASSGAAPHGVQFGGTASNQPTNIVISNNIIAGNFSGSASGGKAIISYWGSSSSGTYKIWNNIIYGWVNSTNDLAGMRIDNGTAYIYSNTVYNCYRGYNLSNNSGTIIAKNDIAQNTGLAGFTGGPVDNSSDYNISDHADAPGTPGSHNKNSTTVSFVDATNKDFHLASADTAARNAGVNLSADTNFAFSTDIDGNGRGTWDIGADEGSNEMVATVMSAGGDYSTLSAWQTGMVTDLMTPTTMVYGGTMTSTIADNASLYLCRTGVYQNVTATTVHSTATQLLAETISSPTSVVLGDVWYTNNTCNSANYFTTTDAGNPAIATAKIDGAWASADTTSVTISGWTTGPQNYVRIYTTTTARHQGKWDTGKYRLEGTNTYLINISANHVKIDGVQIGLTSTASANAGILILTSASSEISLSNNIIKGNVSGGGTNTRGLTIGSASALGTAIKAWNNIIYGFVNGSDNNIYGIRNACSNATLYAYNNTIYNSYNGMDRNSGNIIAKNNIVQAATVAYSGTLDATSANNISNDNTSPNSGGSDCGTHSCRNQSVVFASVTNSDFHLSTNDTAARDSGATLSADANLAFTTDIDGSTRTGTWDIGADEAAIPIFYSVGQNTSDHSTGLSGATCSTTGACTVTIASGVATFNYPQTATNLGVGDKVTYNTNSVAYISQKISNDKWKLETATGGTPADVSGQTVNSIAHAFNALGGASGALNGGAGVGAKGASFLNTADLVAGNYQLNVPCYYDSAADTSAVTISGWTTASTNYIKAYTPYNTVSEINQSQRHPGKWDTGKYRIEVNNAIAINAYGIDYIRIDGLQIKLTASASSDHGILTRGTAVGSTTDIQISNNIIQGVISDVASDNGAIEGYWASTSPNTIRIWNNIIYGFVNGANNYEVGIRFSGINVYAYNNTVSNTRRGFVNEAGYTSYFVAKNNIAQNTTTGYSGAFDASSDYNISDHADAPGAHSKNSATVSFADTTTQDYHLAFNDTVAKSAGTNLSVDSYLAFNTDIDGNPRPGAGLAGWDIGADEAGIAKEQSTNLESKSITNGLVMYQSFDGSDINGTTAIDRSGQGNDGTIASATQTSGKRGQALSFNGSSSLVTVNKTSSLNLSTSATLSVWFKTNGNKGSNYSAGLVGKHDTSGDSNYTIKLYSSGYGFTIRQSNGTYVYNADPSKNYAEGGWHHMVGVADSSTLKTYVYVDGVLQSGTTQDYDGTIKDDAYISSILIGNDYDNNKIDGSIDEVRVYNRALSVDEIGDLYQLGNVKMNSSQNSNITAGLIGDWSFNGADISGVNAYDRSGQNNHGTISGATPTIGKIGQALSFDGVSASYVRTTLTSTLSTITISAWIKPHGWGPQQKGRIIDKHDAGAESILLYMCGSTNCNPTHPGLWFQRDFTGVDGVWGIPTSSLTFNQWQHIVVTYDDSSLSNAANIYVNGVLQSLSMNTSPTGSADNNSDPFFIGNRGAGDRTWDGSLDEVRIYNRILSTDEIGDLYRMGQVKINK
jgi:acid phosphatase family membrane protein YuiD